VDNVHIYMAGVVQHQIKVPYPQPMSKICGRPDRARDRIFCSSKIPDGGFSSARQEGIDLLGGLLAGLGFGFVKVAWNMRPYIIGSTAEESFNIDSFSCKLPFTRQKHFVCRRTLCAL